jgi:hypothetical protein
MPCPFPGMDPYLEMQPYWGDFAPKILSEISNHLLARLLPRYDVRLEEYVLLTEDEIRLHRLRPDVAIATTDRWKPGRGGAAVAEPLAAELEYPAYEEYTQRHLKIVHLPTERVVTVIELLSPSNKLRGEGGLDTYLAKRAELLTARCNLVELDLLRGGQRLPMTGQIPPGDYDALIGPIIKRPKCTVIAWTVRSPLPTINIPLLDPDPDLLLDLQTVFRAAYEPAFYDQRLHYELPLDPPLSERDQAWVGETLSRLNKQ